MSDFYERINNLSQKRLVLLAMEQQARLAALEGAAPAPKPDQHRRDIAIIGMACRFPGEANTPQDFWELLQQGRDAITEIPRERWDVNAYFDDDVEATGKMSTRWGGFMSAVDQFDPALFGITPREAATMDPQQRIMLEVCWEALERAGYAPDKLSGSSTGVFVGACNNDYAQMMLSNGLDNADMYLATGSAHSVISGRVSYVLGLTGPAISVDTACSSSLVALHYAVQSLRSGECRMALAGGVNAILSPDISITLSKAKMMASDGRCKAFDADADGFVRSEGCGIVVLKRLADAEADGDKIIAIIRGSAINQDGRSNGLTAPNGPSQVAVIRAALADAAIAPADVDYVETHGTGTSLGDPIEAQALGAALGAGRNPQNPLLIGSVKTNLGHLESAAGIAGLIKLALSLQHAELPPHLHLKRRSPHIPWESLPLSIPTEPTPWPRAGGQTRTGALSSFGFSGTNVHLILQSYQPTAQPASTPPQPRDAHLLTLSAKSAVALDQLAHRYESLLVDSPAEGLGAIALAGSQRRAHLPYRLALTATTTAEARQKLNAYRSDPDTSPVIHAAQPAPQPPDVTFLYTGHGAQFAQMGRKLYETEPVFRQMIERINQLANAYLPRPLLEALYPEETTPSATPALMDTMTYAQPAIFALQIALAELWRSWGIQPAAVAGHSVGEYAAAVTAGIFSLEDGLKLVCARGRLMDALPVNGSMASVFASIEQIDQILRPHSGEVSVAVVNDVTNIVISGVSSAVEAVLTECAAQGIKTRRLAIPAGAHSPLVDPMRAEFEAVIATVQFSRPRIDLISCTTGQPVSAEEVSSVAYWWRHLRQPVQFARLLQTLREREMRVFVEIGPDAVLLSIGQRALPAGYGVWLPSLRENSDDTLQMLETLGGLYVHGAVVDWNGFAGGVRAPHVPLPTYPFDHQRYWFTPSAVPAAVQRGQSGVSPLLGARLQSPALEATVFESQLSAKYPAYLDHHRIFGVSIAPSPAYIEMAVRAAEALFGGEAFHIANLTIQEAMILPEDGLKTAQIILNVDDEASARFKIVSLETNGGWKTHATGVVARQQPPPAAASVATPQWIAEIQARCTEQIEGADYYAMVAGLGLEFGESFRGLHQIWRRDGEALGKIELSAALRSELNAYRFHPALLDACFHLIGAPLPGGMAENAYLLIGIEHFRLYRTPGTTLWNHTVLTEKRGEIFTGDIHLFDEDGNLVAEVQGMLLKRASRALLLRAVHTVARLDDWFYQMEWQSAALPAPQRNAPTQACLPEGRNADAFAAQISAAGLPCHVLPTDQSAPGGSALLFTAVLDEVNGASLLDQSVNWCAAALDALRANPGARLWIITRGAQPVMQSAVEPSQAVLWGLGRVIALEHPERWGGLIDLDPAQPVDAQIGLLAAEIRAGDVEDQVAFRDGSRLVARLARAARPDHPSYTFNPNAAYLVTGGLGGLGLQIAQWMAAQGAHHIVLIGRRGLPERAAWDTLAEGSPMAAQVAAIRQIEAASDARIEVSTLDVGNAAALSALIAEFGKLRPPLKGVIHAAAALGNCHINELSSDDLREMFWPKILGTWNLHEATRDLKLDFFALFSSTTALWGSNQLGHYAAANTFLDAFAHYRRAQGLPALSINWGTWEIMRVASAAEQQRVAQFGLEQMPPEAALNILGGLLTENTPQIAVAAVNWETLKPAYEARRVRPLLTGLTSRKTAPEKSTETRRETLAGQIKHIPHEERRAFLVDYVRRQVASVINTPDPTALNIQQGLFEMGLDSLMSVELKGRLENAVAQPLPSTLTFNYPTIADLARYLDENLLTDSPPSAPPPPAANTSTPAAPTRENVDHLSEDDLAALLASKLSKLK